MTGAIAPASRPRRGVGGPSHSAPALLADLRASVAILAAFVQARLRSVQPGRSAIDLLAEGDAEILDSPGRSRGRCRSMSALAKF
jgi:hypothetical protein